MSNNRTASDRQAASERSGPPAIPQPNVSASQRLKKLTIANVIGAETNHRLRGIREGINPKPSAPIWLADFYCQVTGHRTGSTTYGDYTVWLGDFRSVNLETGEMLSASTAIFPDIAADLISAARMGGEAIGGGAANIMLGFRIGVEAHPRTGYAYCLKDIAPVTQKTGVDLFMEAAYGNQPALPAPEEDSEREAA